MSKLYPIQRYIAPDGLDLNTGVGITVNIVEIFKFNTDENKSYIYQLDDTTTTLVLPVVTSQYYAYGEYKLGVYYNYTASSGTVTWISGSSKRWVITFNPNYNITATLPKSAIWAYVSEKANNIMGTYQGALRYVFVRYLDSLKTVSNSAFQSNAQLTGIIEIPPAVTSIGASAYYSNNYITKVVIPKSVISIGDTAFYSNLSLTSFVISENLTVIGFSAFLFSNIQNFTIYGTNWSTSSDGYCLYNYAKTRLLYVWKGRTGQLTIENTTMTIDNTVCYNNTNVTGLLTIPAAITSVGQNAFLNTKISSLIIEEGAVFSGFYQFQNCTALTSVDIPNSITNYGINFFYNCTALNTIISRRVVPIDIPANAFFGVNKSTCTVYVPAGTVAAYRTKTNWNVFTNILELP